MKLKQIMTSKNLTYKALSDLSGVPVRTIEDLISRNDGRVSTLIKLADALGVTLDELCKDQAAYAAFSFFGIKKSYLDFY